MEVMFFLLGLTVPSLNRFLPFLGQYTDVAK